MQAQELTAQTQYDAQALRIESSWGKRLLVRGREGTVVGEIGSRRFDFPGALARSPNAVREAKEFARTYSRGNTILALGILAWGVGGGVARIDDIDAAVAIPAWTAVAAGTFMMAYGGVQLNKAFTALARSIWWYNRDLQPST
jgi:hypothetical protein